MIAKAPVWESFNISSFFSLGWWEPSASAVSQKPSKWMAPLTATGSSNAPAARSQGPISNSAHSSSHNPRSRPITTPTTGKKHSAQERLFRSHST